MPTYNQADYLKDSIDSILAQTYRDFELIVVDDGSTDTTSEILASYGEPRMRVIRKENGGTGTALNVGFDVAKGEFETWFASDNLMYPHNFEFLLNGMTHATDFVYADCDVECSHTGKRWLYSDGHPKKTIEYRIGGIIEKLFFPSIMWLWRRNLRERAGGKFTSMLCEDTDMILRMEDYGRFKYLGKKPSGFYRLKNESSLTGTIQSVALSYRDRIIQNARTRRLRNKISVMIPVYNREKSIMHAIQSCINQTYQNIEIIVVDDGSTDNTLNICKIMASRDTRVKVFHQEHAGCSAARNEALRQSSGAYIALLDSDDYDEPARLEKSLNFLLENNLDFMTCGGVIHHEDGATEDYCPILDAEKMLRGDMLAIPFCPTILYRKELIKSVGPYQEICFAEDVDLIARFCLFGAKYGCLNEMLYHYQRGPDQLSKAHDIDAHLAARDLRVEQYLPEWELIHV